MIRQSIQTLFLCSFGLVSGATNADVAFPGETWFAYDDASRYGWSSDELAAARRYAEEAGVASYMIVESGYVVEAWGDVARRYKCHSVRKSFLSALIGMHVDAGEIDTSATVGELGIDDLEPLTPVEKSATVLDLLKARSGVYHGAAYETAKMKARRPRRGSHAPGTHYYYNNWDFNVLAAILEDRTGRDVFSAFRDELADPLGMQDFRMIDTYFHLEADKSRYPAYPFMLSTRDAARFGLLYLANGEWDGTRILSERWIEASRTAWSEGVRDHRGYGLLWWVSEDPVLARFGMYHAAGVGGQIIAVVPAANLVIVQRVDTYVDDAVTYEQTLELMRRVVAARRGTPVDRPVSAVPLVPRAQPYRSPGEALRTSLAGAYVDTDGNPVMTLADDGSGNLLAKVEFDDDIVASSVARMFNSGQRFRLVRGADGELELESTRFPVRARYRRDKSAAAVTITSPDGKVTLRRETAAGP